MGAETREADQGQASVNPGDQALKKKQCWTARHRAEAVWQRVCVQCGGLNRVEYRCVCDWLTPKGRKSQVCWIVLIETVTLSVLEFPDVSSTFAAVEQNLPQYLKFVISHHLFIL